MIWDELCELTAKQKLLISVLETIKLEEYFPYISRAPGCPLEDCTAIARAFVTKMVYNMATTRILLDRLESDPTVIEQHLEEQIVGHISRDSTVITARENPEKKAVSVEKKSKKRGRPRKGEEHPKALTRLEQQSEQQPLSEMLAELPWACNLGTKRNSKGYKTS